MTKTLPEDRTASEKQEKRWELGVFLFLNFIFWPVLSVMVVGGYGFAVWISQWYFGPPGPL